MAGCWRKGGRAKVGLVWGPPVDGVEAGGVVSWRCSIREMRAGISWRMRTGRAANLAVDEDSVEVGEAGDVAAGAEDARPR